MIDHVNQRPEVTSYGVAAVLLANAAMAMRNLIIVIVFTLSVQTQTLFVSVIPLGVVIVVSIALAAIETNWHDDQVSVELETPFTMRNALGFGALFLFVVLAGGIAESLLGRVGFYATAVVTGLVSSAGATTSAVVLYRSQTLSANPTLLAVMLATFASIVVKALLTVPSENRTFTRDVIVRTAVVLTLGAVSGVAVLL
jgi:uncharacterized membrane protein (DUF4010 family)